MKELPPVCKGTGIVMDYLNEYTGRDLLAQRRGIEALLQSLRERTIQHYEQRFDPAVYDYVASNPRIPILNQIADYVNMKTREGTLTLETYLAMEEEAFALIHEHTLHI